MIKIFNEDCFETMQRMYEQGEKVDLIITSPPYHTPNDKVDYSEKGYKNYQTHYDVFRGWESNEAYRKWSITLFKYYEEILSKNGVVLYNISYTVKNTDCIYFVLTDIISRTGFTVVDCISWKKNNALPMNMNSNRLTRVCEFIFVFCRKTEIDTFYMNKEKSGSKYKNLFFNYIEAPNNDILSPELNKLNNATFSSQLVRELLHIYAKDKAIVYDSFMGTGTTAVACKSMGFDCIGSELSSAQCELANKRLSGVKVLQNANVRSLF